MAASKEDRRKARRKEKQKEARQHRVAAAEKERALLTWEDACWYMHQGDFKQALTLVEGMLRKDPDHVPALQMLVDLGVYLDRPDLWLRASWPLFQLKKIRDEHLQHLVIALEHVGRDQDALAVAEAVLALCEAKKIRRPVAVRKEVLRMQARCQARLQFAQQMREWSQPSEPRPRRPLLGDQPGARPAPAPAKAVPEPSMPAPPPAPAAVAAPSLPVTVELATQSLRAALTRERLNSRAQYDLALSALGIRLQDAFEDLLCLAGLSEVRSFWYQEETAKKVLKGFRGRALLADEVGLGKTIEACIVLKEYLLRGMVKTGLILTPAPLVSQWRDELAAKFGLAMPCTDDADYRSGSAAFWQQPLVLASLNQAKSKRNFDLVVSREYDIVIVDEAHHLKNRNTLSWKLVNALQKRFLLLLTATPVENNLMELYNLVTLLKPGQLKTAAAFRQEFMSRSDPTDPQNRERLRELLGQVMIRNTRAVARLEIPPRFAHTVRVTPSPTEKELYDRVTTLVRTMNSREGQGRRLVLESLLAEAGSSPRAVSRTLTRLARQEDWDPDLRQEVAALANMARDVEISRKNEVLLQLLAKNPDKTIVFVKFTATLEYLAELFDWHRIPFARFHGGLSNEAKDQELARFRADVDLLLATEVGGEGRNLQFCHQMVNYDLPWNPMKIEQRIGRLHRIGQEHQVLIWNLAAVGSIEDYILEILDKKINMFELVIGEIDMILGRTGGEEDFADLVYDIWLRAATEADRTQAFDELARQLKRSKTAYQRSKALDDKLFGETYEM
ncbi:MAG: SNF2-related protein [Thermodesulfobacteriota bacterium]